jgi:hypothetical protein
VKYYFQAYQQIGKNQKSGLLYKNKIRNTYQKKYKAQKKLHKLLALMTNKGIVMNTYVKPQLQKNTN